MEIILGLISYIEPSGIEIITREIIQLDLALKIEYLAPSDGIK